MVKKTPLKPSSPELTQKILDSLGVNVDMGPASAMMMARPYSYLDTTQREVKNLIIQILAINLIQYK